MQESASPPTSSRSVALTCLDEPDMVKACCRGVRSATDTIFGVRLRSLWLNPKILTTSSMFCAGSDDEEEVHELDFPVRGLIAKRVLQGWAS